jgi:hypothetical protein
VAGTAACPTYLPYRAFLSCHVTLLTRSDTFTSVRFAAFFTSQCTRGTVSPRGCVWSSSAGRPLLHLPSRHFLLQGPQRQPITQTCTCGRSRATSTLTSAWSATFLPLTLFFSTVRLAATLPPTPFRWTMRCILGWCSHAISARDLCRAFAGCNSVSKLLPIIVDMKAFGEALQNAIDVIGEPC